MSLALAMILWGCNIKDISKKEGIDKLDFIKIKNFIL